MLPMSTDEAFAPAREASRIERARVTALDRMLRSCGFVRSYRLEIDTSGALTGEVTAPVRLLRQSLAPVLDARGVGYEIRAPTAPRHAETVVTADLHPRRGGR